MRQNPTQKRRPVYDLTHAHKFKHSSKSESSEAEDEDVFVQEESETDDENDVSDESSSYEGETTSSDDSTPSSTNRRVSSNEWVVEEEVFEEERPSSTSSKRKRRSSLFVKKVQKRPNVLEYDLKDMYPEVDVLVVKKKKDWDFTDPNLIRAIWLEGRTNAVAEWKVRFGKIRKPGKPKIPVLMNNAAQLRLEFQKEKIEREKTKSEKESYLLTLGKDAPEYTSTRVSTNTTAEMRYRYTRNEPPVPGYYINHFSKYKKPPFRIAGVVGACFKVD